MQRLYSFQKLAQSAGCALYCSLLWRLETSSMLASLVHHLALQHCRDNR